MTAGHSPRPLPAGLDTEIVIVGGGLSGTLAAILLGRRGYHVTLIDRHEIVPREFRVEKIAGDQIDKMRRIGLLESLSAKASPFSEIINLRKGRLLDRTRELHYGIFYDDLVGTMRAELPKTVQFIAGRVGALEANRDRQRVSIVGQGDITAQLLVLATGMGDILRRDLGIDRRFVHRRQSMTFGFNLKPVGASSFAHQALTYYGEGTSDGIDYLSLFPAGGTTRANLFVFREPDDPFVKAVRERPRDALVRNLPGLVETFGDFEVTDRVSSWLTDITVAENCKRDGAVLIGDAYQTSCPAAGTGVSRLLTDIERLCMFHVPQWMGSPGIGAEKIAAFYNDPVKQAMDAYGLQQADFRRSLTIDSGLRWQARRQVHFSKRRILNEIDRISPNLAAVLRRLKRSGAEAAT